MAVDTDLRYEQLDPLGEDQLLHIARNESALRAYRIAAVELLLERRSDKAYHPDLKSLRDELEVTYTEELGVFPVPEVPHESETTPVEDSTGPLKASVTTATMFGVQKMDKSEEIVPAVEAQEPEQN